MLLELHIKNFALIEQASVEYREGLTVLSGETGAGKSILIDAINIALGDKAGKEYIRTGCEEAVIELIFSIEDQKKRELIQSLDIPMEEDILIIHRKIGLKRSVFRVNDENITAAKLKKITYLLIDIHGQHAHQSLLHSSTHLTLLDSYATNMICELKKDLAQRFIEYRKIADTIKKGLDEAERNRELEILTFEIEELETHHIKDNEEEILENKRTLLKNTAKIEKALQATYDVLDEGTLTDALSQILHVESFDEKIATIGESLTTLNDIVSDTKKMIESYLIEIDFDEVSYEKMMARLDEIRHLKTKYKTQDLKNVLEKKKEKRSFLEVYEKERDLMKKKKKALEREMLFIAHKLSKVRMECAKVLEEKIRNELLDLNFLGVFFEITFGKKEHMGADGYDHVEFMISTNPGHPIKRLCEVASGGELSRIMLALKTVFADGDHIDTLIFDEIDSGISGKTATKVGEKLSTIAKNHQVLCISHLAQIVAIADENMLITKSTDGISTKTDIRKLNSPQKLSEITRLMGGEGIDAVRESAKLLLEHAENFKKTRK